MYLFIFIFIYYKVSYIKYRNIHRQRTAHYNVESAESANSAVRCSKQTQLNCQSLISAKSCHSLKCWSYLTPASPTELSFSDASSSIWNCLRPVNVSSRLNV